MLNLTLLDHLRLTFGHVVYRHGAHARLASTRARWSRGLRAAEALLMTGVGIAAFGAASGRGAVYAIAAALLASVALIALLIHLTFDLDGAARAHAQCATQLWRIRERYHALLSDLSDGAIDLDEARCRRDRLMNELYRVYDHAPPGDERAYQAASQATLTDGNSALADEEVDRFLPRSLHKPGTSAAA